MQRLRTGVIGAGLIAQVEHIPNLLHLRDRFDLIAVSDPSPGARAFVTERYRVPTVATADELLALPMDAVVIAAPDPWHAELVQKSLAAGLNVFCEKPLCYGVAEAEAIAAARDEAGKVVQVGYMKRFDPSYRAAARLMPGTKETLRYVSVEVHDPDAWPFVRHHPFRPAADVPENLIAETKARQVVQIEAALGFVPDETLRKGFTGAYCSSLVHDVNAVHGLLDALEAAPGEPAGAAIFAEGTGGQGSVWLEGRQGLWNMVHLQVPGLADYRERISFYFDAAVLELEFPAPYLNHQPTRLCVRRSDGHTLTVADVRDGFEEPFVLELQSFWSAVVEGTPVVNTVEAAARDVALLAALLRRAAGR
ncbi:MAG: Gfo/Idh/MocA family oxidoreductase [Geminicoccaceae bacterium]